MEQLRPVSKTEKILFFRGIIVTTVGALCCRQPPLAGLFNAGQPSYANRRSPRRLSETAQNELINIVTIFSGLTVGAKANAEAFLTAETIKIILPACLLLFSPRLTDYSPCHVQN